MTYAHVTDGTVDQFGNPPATAEVDGRWHDLRPRDPDVLAIAGWYDVVETPRPADTDTTTHDVSYTFDGDSVNQTWTQRPWTVDELEQRRLAANAEAIGQAIAAAIAKLDTLIAAPALATVPAGTLTTAQLSTALRTLRDQAQATRAGAQDVALILKRTIKLVRGDYDTVD